MVVIKRLNTQTVTGGKQTVLACVPNGESEHPSQMLNAVPSVLFIKMENGFGITVGTVLMPVRLHLRAQGEVVVDFTIEDYPQRSVLVADVLMPGREINNTESAHA